MKILFVCTGNSCRSPMAEAIARDIFQKMKLNIEVASGGISVLMSLPASDNAIEVMKNNYLLDISGHKTHQITKDDLAGADIVLGMTERHKNYLSLQAPEFSHKIYTVSQFAGLGTADISDPFGGDEGEYRKSAEEINGMLQVIATKIKEERNSKIAIGCDHGGFQLKLEVMKYLDKNRLAYQDFGTNNEQAVDYPVYAKKVADAILSGQCSRGVLICGTGIGISIAANRHKGIRAALCHDVFSAKATRQHNNANILAMGGRVVGAGLALEILEAFLNTRFSNDERHINRINLMEDFT